jgi:hypothetical protein
MAGLTKIPHFSGEHVTHPEFPPLKGDFTPWTGGLPPNPVPVVGKILGTATRNSPPSAPFGQVVRAINPGRHLGLGRFKKNGLPVPITVPNRFRITPPPQWSGQRPTKLGGFHVPADLHASILPSNPMAFKTFQQIDNRVNNVLNENATVRGLVKRVTGVANGSR